MKSGETCPVCNTALFAFVRMRTNEYVLCCPNCKRLEWTGANWEEVTQKLHQKTFEEQKALL